MQVERTWSIGTIATTTAAVLTLVAVLSSAIFNYAGLSYAISNIPDLQNGQKENTKAISVNAADIGKLKQYQKYNDKRQDQILQQLKDQNDKLDRLLEEGRR